MAGIKPSTVQYSTWLFGVGATRWRFACREVDDQDVLDWVVMSYLIIKWFDGCCDDDDARE